MGYHHINCQCSIFKSKNISLPILVIHSMLVEIEDKLDNSEDFEILERKFSGSLVNKFIFHTRVKIDPPGQLQKKLHLYTECTISSLRGILKNYLGFGYLISIEMCDADTYNKLETEYFENNIKRVEIYPLCLSYGKFY